MAVVMGMTVTVMMAVSVTMMMSMRLMTVVMSMAMEIAGSFCMLALFLIVMVMAVFAVLFGFVYRELFIAPAVHRLVHMIAGSAMRMIVIIMMRLLPL
ncbi:hypothetical protein PAESOLCIP111_01663 [Paenibacillus solanacearum]|uniref:Uncharacterized protein n=1 Tax=Paenibacillus solanacearum TaxID=2048548 RepID=A0A916K001_9BACL|nr:hypothetical protein [Paenibacillus solanacearum]CAG7613968.1 hypothetical protein PAESOLCIP111_01663 [Paenibacillus solanacearum]